MVWRECKIKKIANTFHMPLAGQIGYCLCDSEYEVAMGTNSNRHPEKKSQPNNQPTNEPVSHHRRHHHHSHHHHHHHQLNKNNTTHRCIVSAIRDKYLCNYMNDIVLCGWPHIKIMNNGFVFPFKKLGTLRCGVGDK